MSLGSHTKKVVPLSESLFTCMIPWCSSTKFLVNESGFTKSLPSKISNEIEPFSGVNLKAFERRLFTIFSRASASNQLKTGFFEVFILNKIFFLRLKN